MAHFAELIQKKDPTGFTTDLHWVVERVIVVDNKHVSADEALDGENWCSTFFGGGTWKQTSYNHNFRKQYAGKGYIFDSAKNKFLTQQPFASWSLNSNDDWAAPIESPTVKDDGQDPAVWYYNIYWDENAYNADNAKGWKATKSNDTAETKTIYDWNGTAWVSA
tara:strand:+ start:417 stop:908 length:492 start_codon:yes stop_codon:yes gene_type:complete